MKLILSYKMKTLKSIFAIFNIIGLNTYVFPQSEFPVLKGPYFGQKPPGKTPEVFAPGIVSIQDAKYSTISFSAKMDEFYLYRWDGASAKIMFSRIVNGVWTPLAEVGFTKGYKAMEPHITFDNKRIYFNWDKPVPEGKRETPFKIWYSERIPSGWSDPEYAGIGMFVSSDREGNIFTTDMSSTMTDGKTYLSKVKLNNGHFINYERLTIQPYSGVQAHPCIAPDGNFIIFDIDSGHHLFASFKQSDGTWSNAIDLTDNGLDIMAGAASLTPDGKFLFFNCKGQLWWVDINMIEDLRFKIY
jgi:hypothetical protein